MGQSVRSELIGGSVHAVFGLHTPVRFARKVLLFFSPILAVFMIGEFLLWRTGETWPITRVIRAQKEQSSALFMRGILDQAFYCYKFLQFEARRSKVLVLGSSRVMEFRAEMFGVRSNEFFNAGGMIQDLSDLDQFAAKLASDTPPEVLILGLDLWWFNGNKPLLNGLNPGVGHEAAFDWQEHVRALRRFKSSKNRAPILSAYRARNDNIGIEARSSSAGFRSDGSLRYNFPLPVATDWKFVDREKPPIVERIRNSSAQFTPSNGISPERLQILRKCLDIFRAHNILVLGFLPPFSSESAALLEQNHSNLWREARLEIPKMFRSMDLPFFDASLLRDVQLDDRSMIDGIHAAETFHLVLLERFLAEPRIAAHFPGLATRIRSILGSVRTNPWLPDYLSAGPHPGE